LKSRIRELEALEFLVGPVRGQVPLPAPAVAWLADRRRWKRNPQTRLTAHILREVQNEKLGRRFARMTASIILAALGLLLCLVAVPLFEKGLVQMAATIWTISTVAMGFVFLPFMGYQHYRQWSHVANVLHAAGMSEEALDDVSAMSNLDLRSYW